MDLSEYARDRSSADQPAAPEVTEPVAAWEEIEDGRYQPRRVRGSCHGRELGWTFVVPSREDDSKKA